MVLEVDLIAREEVIVELDTVVIGHGCDVIDDDLVGLGLDVGNLRGVVVAHYEINVVAIDGRGLYTVLKVGEKSVIHSLHNGSDVGVKHAGDGIRLIDMRIVLTLRLSHRGIVLGVDHNIGLAVAVLYYIDLEIINNLGVDGADAVIAEVAGIEHLCVSGIDSILTEVGDDVTDADYAALKGRGENLKDILLVDIAALGHCIKLGKGVHLGGAILVHLVLAVMRDDTVEGIEGEIHREDTVKDSNAMDIMIEISACLSVVYLGKVSLACVAEGGVSDIVTKRDSLDEIEIKIQGASNRAGDTRNELNVERTTGNVIIL